METIQSTWQRIDTWLSLNAPHIWQDIQSGASETEILQTEAAVGLKLPEDVKSSYRIHNGGYKINLVSGMKIFSLVDIISEWQMFKELDEGETWSEAGPPYYVKQSLTGRKFEAIQPVWWDTHWIPFGRDLAGNYCCIDLAPTSEGYLGQIIDWDHAAGPSRVLASSFSNMLFIFASDLEAGAYVVDVNEGFIHRSKL